mmetsp:Transcript_120290/g.340355  ORF Transcript_120290/g.340355 Transcript_120290/m.340355 type:complete len:252 (-) Transcript_120290:373-1128(-)
MAPRPTELRPAPVAEARAGIWPRRRSRTYPCPCRNLAQGAILGRLHVLLRLQDQVCAPLAVEGGWLHIRRRLREADGLALARQHRRRDVLRVDAADALPNFGRLLVLQAARRQVPEPPVSGERVVVLHQGLDELHDDVQVVVDVPAAQRAEPLALLFHERGHVALVVGTASLDEGLHPAMRAACFAASDASSHQGAQSHERRTAAARSLGTSRDHDIVALQIWLQPGELRVHGGARNLREPLLRFLDVSAS